METLKKVNEEAGCCSSAVRCNSDESCEDGSLWGDSDEEQSGVTELDREWKKRREQFYNHGYREGISAGKHDSAQEGFNDGFKDSVLVGYGWGFVRGVTGALAYLPDQLKEKVVDSEDERREFKSLHESVHQVSSEAALKLFHDEVKKNKSGEDQIEKCREDLHPLEDQSADSQILSLGDYSGKLESLLQQSSKLSVHPKMNGNRLP